MRVASCLCAFSLVLGCGSGASSTGPAGGSNTQGVGASGGAAMGGQDGGGATTSGGDGPAVANLPPGDCTVDADCAFAQRYDMCCSCGNAYSRDFIRQSRCVVGLGEPAPEGCVPAECGPCANDCADPGGVICDGGECATVLRPGGYDCDAERAYCPISPPLDGTDCCNAADNADCMAVCGASTFACSYDRCSASGAKLTATCSGGTWQVTSAVCPECPMSCDEGELCLVLDSLQASAVCRSNPCGPGYVDCACAGDACDAEAGSCDSVQTGGKVLVCAQASSAD